MALVSWNDGLSVGVGKFDREHQKLIGLINDLHEAMKQGKAKDAVQGIINGLIQYTKSHFSSEEQAFSSYKYPLAAKHILEHQAFVQKVADFQKKYDEGAAVLSLEVMNFLKDWLVNHIQKVDKQYGAFFIEKGLK